MRDVFQTERCKNGGFSLIELSIVLVIMSMLLIPFIKAYDVYYTQKRLDDTKTALKRIDEALSNFYGEQGRYPCPADRSLGFGDVGHGVEQCAEPVPVTTPPTPPNPPIGLQVLTNNTCGGSNPARGYCRVTNAGGDIIYIGSVPYVTLGIPGVEMLDGWKRNLTYAVTASMVDATTFDPAEGRVEVVDEFGTSQGLKHGVVFSSGQDGMGGFDIDGNSTPCVAGGRQFENCNDDSVFMSSLIYEADGNTYFDDMLVTNDWTRSGIWAYIDDENIHSTNPGNIGIGTEDPQRKLDVVGAVRSTDNMQSPLFCDTNGGDCFPSLLIGGSGMGCTQAGHVARGISNNSMDCLAPYEVNDTCDLPNQYVVGIGPGGVICQNLPAP